MTTEDWVRGQRRTQKARQCRTARGVNKKGQPAEHGVQHPGKFAWEERQQGLPRHLIPVHEKVFKARETDGMMGGGEGKGRMTHHPDRPELHAMVIQLRPLHRPKTRARSPHPIRPVPRRGTRLGRTSRGRSTPSPSCTPLLPKRSVGSSCRLHAQEGTSFATSQPSSDLPVLVTACTTQDASHEKGRLPLVPPSPLPPNEKPCPATDRPPGGQPTALARTFHDDDGD